MGLILEKCCVTNEDKIAGKEEISGKYYQKPIHIIKADQVHY